MTHPRSDQEVLSGLDLVVPLDEPDVESWRRRTTAAFQDFVRFGLLIGESVGVGDLPRIGDEQAIRPALDRAHGTGALDSLPDGLGTPLGRSLTNGRDLSGGQWQKVALGRAMMRERPLLLFVSRRFSTVRAADLIVVVGVGTLGYLSRGAVDWRLALVAGIPGLCGVLIGWRIARATPASRLKRIMIAALLVAACIVGLRSY